jgi:dTDP-4-dehydrorhamnose 3,5-epimerase
MWVPPGFAHGFLALADAVDVVYKVTRARDPDDARVLRWDDPDVGVAWPLSSPPLLSPADAAGARLADAEVYP